MSLPSGYTQLEYIQSSGAQYINTGVVPNGNSRIVMDCEPMDVSATFCFFCARTQVSATDTTANVVFYVGGTYRRDFYGESKSTSGAYGAGRRFELDANQNNVSFGTDYALSFTASSKASPMPVILMASAVPGSTAGTFADVNNYAKMRLYACQIYDGETLVRDLIPCKDSSGAVGLYDVVGAAFYANAGSGAFAEGPEVVEPPEPPSTRTLTITLYAGVISVSGTVNGADCTWTQVDDTTTWQTTVERAADEIYRAALTAVDEYGSSAWNLTLYYGLQNFPALITDRTAADAAQVLALAAKKYSTWTAEELAEWLGESKGAYNATDLNRVGSAVGYLAACLRDYGTTVTVSPKDDWERGDEPTQTEMAAYLADIAALRAVLPLPDGTPPAPADMRRLNWEEANAIESILLALDDAITRMIQAWYYSGDLYAGET